MIQHGFKVSCELVHNFSDTMKRTYINAEKMLSKRDSGMLSVRKVRSTNTTDLLNEMLALVGLKRLTPTTYLLINFVLFFTSQRILFEKISKM